MGLIIFSGLLIICGFVLAIIEIKKDKTKLRGYIIAAISLILGITIPIIIENIKEKNTIVDPPVIVNASEYPSETPTELPTEKPTTDKPITDDTTTSKPVNEEVITNNEIPLNFTDEGQEIKKVFEAPISGKYRFNFDIDDVNCNYEVELYDLKNDKLFTAYSSESGISYRLTKETTYRIIITQHTGFTTGKVTIKVPEAEKVLVLE